MRSFDFGLFTGLLLVSAMLCGCTQSASDTFAGAPPALSAQQRATVPATLSAQVIDVYDPATNELTIPLVQVGVGFFSDVRITVGSILEIGTAKNTSGVFDRYDPQTNELTIPVVRVGSTLYENVRIKVGTLLAVGPAVASHSVPTDLALVTYPQSYQTATTDIADINTDPCNLELAKVTFPQTWLGRYPLPAVTGAPLKPSTLRAVNLKDIGLQPGNPAFIGYGAAGAPAGCSGELQTALAKTVARLKALGADHVNITQWHWATNNPDGSWYFTSADETFGTITDADLAGFVQAAHGAGLKVIMRNQIQGYHDSANPGFNFVPPGTPENYARWFAAYQAYIAERSVFFQSLAIDVWELGCSVCMYYDTGDGSEAATAIFHAGYKAALATMRQHFTGKTLMSATPWLHLKTDLASQIDIFEFGLWNAPLSAEQASNLSVAGYKAALTASGLQSGIALYDGFGKTVMISYGMQSRSNALTSPGYMEETACTAALGDLNFTPGTCIQREVKTDFSLQAIVHEATLEFINALNMNSTAMVNVTDYWETDSLMPFTAFPNIATSIRGKPAEGIVRAWFAR